MGRQLTNGRPGSARWRHLDGLGWVIGGCAPVTARNRGQDHDQDETKVMCER